MDNIRSSFADQFNIMLEDEKSNKFNTNVIHTEI